MKTVYPLKGAIQNYAWGGKDFIADILNLPEKEDQPYAEYWMGAHPKAPSLVSVESEWMPLNKLISDHKKETLGEVVSKSFFGKLPYLFKVLDVEKMLSIQVHPDKKSAEVGYYAEEKGGIPSSAFDRNFKDDNHKPELMWALTDFWLLHGFRSEQEISEILAGVPEFESLKTVFEPEQDLATLYRHVMEMPKEKVNIILEPLYNRLENENSKSAFKREDPDFWALRAFRDFTVDGNYDRGLFSVYLLNLVNVKPGEIIYQGSGILHAYLEGVNMELMANSDNVLRGGLTPKHVDVPELMKHVTFESVIPQIIKPVRENDVRSRVETPAPDFQLSHLVINSGQLYERKQGMGPEIYFVYEGEVEVGGEYRFSKGEAFFIPDFAEVSFQGDGQVFCAGVPLREPRMHE